nr:AbrB family transcriptional regulator [Ruegeria sp. R14_0]
MPAALGGSLWEALGLPLGWLMGAAVVTGCFAMCNVEVVVPKPLYSVSLAALGAGVGLSITPDVAAVLLVWAPVMFVAACLGIAAAVLMTPLLARIGRMDRSTAFFSLLPGGVIEMANVGETHGADRTIVASLHAVRVAMVVGLLPLALYAAFPSSIKTVNDAATLSWSPLALVLLVGVTGGWAATQLGLPAAWLLGALVAVGLLSSLGFSSGRMPAPLMAGVQVLVGVSLGARFRRDRLSSVPRALAVGFPVLLVIMVGMAIAAATASLVTPISLPTLVLCFSIGGMAEMVLTSKVLGQNVALVAAFQAVRAVLVNASAGVVWRTVLSKSNTSLTPKG